MLPKIYPYKERGSAKSEKEINLDPITQAAIKNFNNPHLDYDPETKKLILNGLSHNELIEFLGKNVIPNNNSLAIIKFFHEVNFSYLQTLSLTVDKENTVEDIGERILPFILTGYGDDYSREIRTKIFRNNPPESTAKIINYIANKQPESIYFLTRSIPEYESADYKFILQNIPEKAVLVTFINHISNPKEYLDNLRSVSSLLSLVNDNITKLCLKNLLDLSLHQPQIKQLLILILERIDTFEEKQRIATMLTELDNSNTKSSWEHIVAVLDQTDADSFTYLLENNLDLAMGILAVKTDAPYFKPNLLEKIDQKVLAEAAVKIADLHPELCADILDILPYPDCYNNIFPEIVKHFSFNTAARVMEFSLRKEYLTQDDDQQVIEEFNKLRPVPPTNNNYTLTTSFGFTSP